MTLLYFYVGAMGLVAVPAAIWALADYYRSLYPGRKQRARRARQRALADQIIAASRAGKSGDAR